MPALTAGVSASDEIQFVQKRFQPPALGGSFLARRASSVLQSTAGFPLQIIIAGRYHDHFANNGDGWHFTERDELLDLIGDLSRHTKLSIDA